MQKVKIEIEKLAFSNKQSLPENAEKLIADVKETLESDEKVKQLLANCGLDNRGITTLFQGSYKDDTANDYFRIIPKSDIDIILLIGDYTQNTLTIIENVENNKKIEDWTLPLTNKFAKYAILNKKNNEKVNEESYREIYKFKQFKDCLYIYLKTKFSNKYEVDNGSKVIKVALNGDNSYVVEIAVAGRLELYFEKNSFKNNDELKWSYVALQEAGLIDCKPDLNYDILKGYNIITSERLPDRPREYYKEIPNFSNFNKYYLSKKNKKTNGNFTHYVQFFKNFKKIWNENNWNDYNLQINVSSFHIESILANLEKTYFLSKPNLNSLNEIIKLLKNKLSEQNYKATYEINKIYKISRNLSYDDYRNGILNLIKGFEISYNA